MIPLVTSIGEAAAGNGALAASVEEASFSWTEWHPHPDVLVVIAALIGAYLFAWRAFGGPRNPENRLMRARLALYASGVGVIYLASGSPLHDLSETYLFSAHMGQHMMLTLIGPPLLIAGTPGWMLRPLLRDPVVLQAARFLLNPLVALIAFNAVTVGTHLPIVTDTALDYHAVHFLVHAVLVGTALQMWWQVFSPLPELPRLGEPWRMGYLFLQSIVPTVPASFLTFASTPLYDFYAEAPRVWDVSVVADQRVAGLIMKLGGTIILWSLITVFFFKWYEEEERDARGLPSWPEAEEELHRMGLMK
ncbi:MAG TPA: cytochrome c oxidase assembly protein [Dehalococcoidia bacterium]|nr:cytochrome c oxidase assembly protein [Dehalococcoidia bacterium]